MDGQLECIRKKKCRMPLPLSLHELNPVGHWSRFAPNFLAGQIMLLSRLDFFLLKSLVERGEGANFRVV